MSRRRSQRGDGACGRDQRRRGGAREQGGRDVPARRDSAGGGFGQGMRGETDGQAALRPAEEAAQEAERQGGRVVTVGLGTAADPSTFRSGVFGVLDEPTLRMIANETGGRYYRADEAGRLREIYRDLARAIGWARRPTDVSPGVAAGGRAPPLLSLCFRAP